MNLELQDKVFIVTGGAKGIGGAVSTVLAGEGAVPVIFDLDKDAALGLKASLESRGQRCHVYTGDLTDHTFCDRAIEEAGRLLGRIDGIVNNAGINDGAGLESEVDRFVRSLHVNLIHYFSIVHHALPWLKKSKGAVVNIASKIAMTGQGGTSGYAASKGAQLALTREWAAELLPYGIRVNAVLPAEVMTPMYRQWLDTFEEPEQKLNSIVRNIPLERRMTSPEEIADTVLFLLSPRNAHTTGQWLVVDGGYVHLDRSLT